MLIYMINCLARRNKGYRFCWAFFSSPPAVWERRVVWELFSVLQFVHCFKIQYFIVIVCCQNSKLFNPLILTICYVASKGTFLQATRKFDNAKPHFTDASMQVAEHFAHKHISADLWRRLFSENIRMINKYAYSCGC